VSCLTRVRRFDTWGLLTLLVTLASLFLATMYQAIPLALLSAGAFVLFLIHERRTTNPLLDLKLFARTKNPWDDIETSTKLYHAKRAQQALHGEVSGQSTNELRSSIIESIRRNPPQDFGQVVKLIQLITEKPVIMTPIRCSNCGADLELPSTGDSIHCTHCRKYFHLTKVIELLERML